MSQPVDFARRWYRAAMSLLRRAHGDDMRFLLNGFPVHAWDDESYDSWFRTHVAGSQRLDSQRDNWRMFPIKPQFSFIVPLYKTPKPYFRTMVDSVLGQTYPNLQLVLVNASSESIQLKQEIESYRAVDSRIIVVELERNLGITENTNAGLRAATGDFCCFLDHDDYIDADLLYEYVAAINDDPEIEVLYCDEDMVVEDSRTGTFKHCHPLIKPEYSPELLLCHNYIVHLMTIKRSIIEAMPCPDSSFDGSQDYNMVLFSTSHARKVKRVPRIMYHWRISESSTATNPDSKPYSLRSCRKAISAQLERGGIDASIIGMGLYLVHGIWFDKGTNGTVSLVADVTDCNRELSWFSEFALQMITGLDVELIVVGSPADVCAYREAGGPGRTVSLEAGGRLSRYNRAAKLANGDNLIFIDADCLFSSADPFGQLGALCSLEGVGVSAPKQLYRNGINKSYGVALSPERVMPMYRGYEDSCPGYQCNLRMMQNVSAVALQGLCIRRRLFERLDGFDEAFGPELGAVDLCHRVRMQGLRVAVTPTVKLEINEFAPERPFDIAHNAADYPDCDVDRFDAKWSGVRDAGDPYLNPNLDQSSNYQQLSARS